MTELIEQIDTMYEVGKLSMRGYATKEIEDKLNLKKKDVLYLRDQWAKHLTQSVRDNIDLHERVMQIIAESDSHYKDIIRAAWELHDAAKTVGEYSNANSALKTAHGAQRDSTAMWKEVGQDASGELLQQIHEAEKTKEIIFDIFREVLCERCKVDVKERVQEVQSTTEVEVIEDDV